MTTDEAAKKWCPYMGAFNGRNADNTMCISTNCMAWRWVSLWDGHKVVVTNKGYCGLAGEIQAQPQE
jgi:hypothetical protein